MGCILKIGATGSRRCGVYLKKLVGLTLVGSAAPEIIIFLYGVAGSGKSTFVNTIMRVLGRDLAVKIPIFNITDAKP